MTNHVLSLRWRIVMLIQPVHCISANAYIKWHECIQQLSRSQFLALLFTHEHNNQHTWHCYILQNSLSDLEYHNHEIANSTHLQSQHITGVSRNINLPDYRENIYPFHKQMQDMPKIQGIVAATHLCCSCVMPVMGNVMQCTYHR